jgi:hypothetical protein
MPSRSASPHLHLRLAQADSAPPTMHRWRSRISSVLAALWLAVVSTVPATTHLCPAHGAGAVGGHHAPIRHAHAQALRSQGATHGDHPAPTQAHHCTCVGPCRCTCPVILKSVDLTLHIAIGGAITTAPLPEYVHIPVAAQHVLPFANAPPQRA